MNGMRLFFLLVFGVAFICCETFADELYKDGVFVGEAEGYIDTVRVSVELKDGKIKDVKIIKQSESKPKKALKLIPKRIVKKNKVDVDTVTGATITSKAIKKAVAKALEKARQNKNDTK